MNEQLVRRFRRRGMDNGGLQSAATKKRAVVAADSVRRPRKHALERAVTQKHPCVNHFADKSFVYPVEKDEA